MFRRNVSIITNIVLTAVLGLILTVASCKKPGQQSPKQPSGETPPETVEQADTNTIKAEASPDARPAGDVEPIPLVLPRPMFVGTPQNFQGVTNLEKPLGRPRDPFYAPKGIANVALNKPVASSDEQPIIGDIAMITDGDKQAADGSFVELGPGGQHITIDLGAAYNIYAVVIWHYHKQPRVYKDVIVQTAEDADFIANVRTIFNNDGDNSSGLGVGQDLNYVETAEGKLIDAKGMVARYVRCYSNGNNANELNNYVEVEVYGLP